MQQHWCIIGGGMLGMTLALRLRQQGNEVTILEAADHLGGLADAWELNGVTWDRHYHVTLMSDLALRAVLREIGLEDDIRWVETKTGFYTDGEFYSMSNTLEFLRFPPLRLVDKLRLGGTIFYASRIKNWKKLEKVPVADWLVKWSGKRTFEKIWLPLLKAKLGEDYQRTSAAFIWATIARMYAARRTGLKKEMFGYVPGGYARTLGAFAKHLQEQGVEIRVGCPAREVTADGRRGVVVDVGDREQLRFDQVVLTVTPALAARLCGQLSDEEKTRLQGIQYVGIVCASLLLRRPLTEYYVTNITETWVPFTAVIEMSALVDPVQFGGHTLVYLPKYVPPDDPLFSASDEEIEETFIAALRRMHPRLPKEDIVSFRVSRVRQVFALSTLDYSTRLPAMTTSVPGIHIVNSAHIVNGTLNVNETVQLAERAVQEILSG